MSGCIFAGTFDPITKGHESIIKKCAKQYGKVYLVIGENENKKSFFSLEDRYAFCKAAFVGNKSVEVIKYSDYGDKYKEFLIKKNIKVYVRGIRNEVDRFFEDSYKGRNRVLYPFLETVYMDADEENETISSTLIRNLIKEGKPFNDYIPEAVYPVLIEALKKEQIGK